MTSLGGSFYQEHTVAMRVNGKNRRLVVKLTRRERLLITAGLKEGYWSRKVFRRAQVLHLLHEGQRPSHVADILRMSAKGVREIGWRYCEGGLQRALYGKSRIAVPLKLHEPQRLAILKMIAGPAPDGFSRWTIRLATAEALRRGLATISRETMRSLINSGRE
jgi:transposase